MLEAACYKAIRYYWISYVGTDGRVIRESSGCTRYKDALSLLLKRKQSVAEGKHPEIKRIANHTFRELVEQYSEWMQGRHRSAE